MCIELEALKTWQRAGAVVVKKHAFDDTEISGNKLKTTLSKKEIFDRILPSMLTQNGKPWRHNLRPFLRQYTEVKRLTNMLVPSESGRAVCNYCSREVRKLEKDSLVASPLSVKADNFLNYYSYGRDKGGVCPDCQFLGVLAPLAMFFVTSKNGNSQRISYIFPEGETLEETVALHNWLSTLGREGNTMSNIEVEGKFYPAYPYETLLLALYSLYKKSPYLNNGKFWLTSVKIAGRNADFTVSDSFSRVNTIRRFFESLAELEIDLASLLDNFVVCVERECDTLPRETLSKLILKGHSIEEFIEAAVFRIKRSVNGLYGFISSYNSIQEVTDIDQTIIDLCKTTGENIGNAVCEKEDFGDPYTLRNCKELEHYLDQLSNLTVKYAKADYTVRIPEDYIRATDEENWKKLKALVVIFAVNKYFARTYAKSLKKGGETA